MAQSPSHKFGQIIGDLIEEVLADRLRAFARKHGLFLDKKGERTARSGKKVTWVDEYGNLHDLDSVLERGGSDKQIGIPVAFIETAWRRSYEPDFEILLLRHWRNNQKLLTPRLGLRYQ
jgi:hypothetical protein